MGMLTMFSNPGSPVSSLEAARRLVFCNDALQPAAAPLSAAPSNSLVSASLEQVTGLHMHLGQSAIALLSTLPGIWSHCTN